MRYIVLPFVLLLTGCIDVTMVAPTPPLPPTSGPPTPQQAIPEATLAIIEKEAGEKIIPEPALYKYEVTIQGKVVDSVTLEEVKNARAVFITDTGTHIFGSRYKLSVPSGSVLRFIITAPGYAKVDKLFKPRLLRNATIDMDIVIGRAPGPVG